MCGALGTPFIIMAMSTAWPAGWGPPSALMSRDLGIFTGHRAAQSDGHWLPSRRDDRRHGQKQPAARSDLEPPLFHASAQPLLELGADGARLLARLPREERPRAGGAVQKHVEQRTG